MNSNKRYLTFFLSGILLSLVSCSPSSNPSPMVSSSSPTPQASTVPSPSVTPHPIQSPSSQPLQDSSRSAARSSTTGAGETVPVTLYQADNQCMALVPEKTNVPVDRSINAAIDKILAQQSHVDFDLSSYQVSVSQGVATVDLRMNPKSQRNLESLSSCEQLELFGSLRKTLTSNAAWKISSVRFTEKGKDVEL